MLMPNKTKLGCRKRITSAH